MTATWSSLAEALAGFPNLPGARCKGLSELFEADDPEEIEFAQHICRSCPALADCRTWFDSLRPSQRPRGVVAGRLNKGPQSVRAAA